LLLHATARAVPLLQAVGRPFAGAEKLVDGLALSEPGHRLAPRQPGGVKGLMPKPIYVLNGPNLNMLGLREPAVYGRESLADLEKRASARAKAVGLAIDFRQSNAEGELVTWIQEARDKAQGIIINAGAYSHSSIAILDALQAAELPVIEVHLSNIFRREEYRQHSFVSLAAKGLICGLGPKGYELALEAMAEMLAAGSRG
jgi:3-dehydroquinate dehydratase-2